ncbi:DUF2867 domain-containing protein [Rhizobiaceae bacterium BDR2-2]|uniref:DUF2867 domain-containing protein n=1 Tax=Ectorhizobium quercum TaxID=2965071 RepID=A0AAE3SWC6_9HYPH|nr:DUF2867 domain-containing protein [Ectorhizobium quercum]MCX8999230.1 DUF2867 domain-containing protein [Ectorhizobium quercum]
MTVFGESVTLPHAALAGADWADGWTLVLPHGRPTALQAAHRMLGNSPAWVRLLMTLRNRIVALFGLKTAGVAAGAEGQIGGFPVVSERDDQVVLGFNDRHLDFRIVIDVVLESAGGSRVSVTTLVDRHNLFGRFYIAAVTPFHRLIVTSALARLAAGAPSLSAPASG